MKKIKYIYIEIKKGVGGVESSLFVEELYNMYLFFLKKINTYLKIICLNKDESGFKLIHFSLDGKMYEYFKYETGIHRIQRIPKTENKGRTHTSTCNVEVNKEKTDQKLIEINKKDIKIETFKSSGAGGQHVNKTNSAVRIRHIKENIIVECQSERSQHKNKEIAIKILKLKIINIEKEKEKKKEKEKRKIYIFKNRSSKIRTYNFCNNIITDHRFKKKMPLGKIMYKGGFDLLIKRLKNP